MTPQHSEREIEREAGIVRAIAELIEPKSWKAFRAGNDSIAHEHRRVSSERKAAKILEYWRDHLSQGSE